MFIELNFINLSIYQFINLSIYQFIFNGVSVILTPQ